MLKRHGSLILLTLGFFLAAFAPGCRSLDSFPQASPEHTRATNLLSLARAEIVSDRPMTWFDLGIEQRGSRLVLTGEVDSVEARLQTINRFKDAGLEIGDETTLLPAADLGQAHWGICCLSVANGRENPEHKAELGTQILMGEVVRLLKGASHNYLNWFLVQSSDGYIAWQQIGNFVRCTRDQADAWIKGPLLVITVMDTRILQEPAGDSEPVSDAVLLNLVRKTGETPGWYQVELPDGRKGYVERSCAEDYQAWKAVRNPTADNIERTARQLLGRPYLWGGNSPRGLDCSGFTKLVFAANGVELRRNASHQAQQGTPATLANDFAQLKKGDLLFFGRKASGGRPERVTHVGIYLGNKTFIHSAERVRIASLDSASPDYEPRLTSRLLHARRILPDQGGPALAVELAR
jgi:gamma-D-glutamyl-L-lysine dipeptidyl-peptidase